MKNYIVYWFVLMSATIFGQATHEAGLVSDNDLYISLKRDQYYTNGIEIFYRRLGAVTTAKRAKTIYEFKMGQYMYNPQTAQPKNIHYHDRPYAGYLFAQAGRNHFYRDESVFKINFQLGTLGPASGAEQLQEGIHKLLGYKKVIGWEYQIQSTLGAQIQLFYSDKLLPKTTNQKIDFNWHAKADLGTIWDGLTTGFTTRITLADPLLPIYNSGLYGAAMNAASQKAGEKKEFYFFITPTVNYQLYDATIQGSLFNDNSPLTYGIKPWRFFAEAGLKYRKNNWNLSYSYIYKSVEPINNAVKSHRYGSIAASYLWN